MLLSEVVKAALVAEPMLKGTLTRETESCRGRASPCECLFMIWGTLLGQESGSPPFDSLSRPNFLLSAAKTKQGHAEMHWRSGGSQGLFQSASQLNQYLEWLNHNSAFFRHGLPPSPITQTPEPEQSKLCQAE